MPKKKYSTELKLETAEKYLKGNIGLKQLANKYYLSSKADIQKWLADYEHHSVQGLNTVNYTYTGDFKVYAVEYMQRTGTSIRKTAAYFNIPSLATG